MTSIETATHTITATTDKKSISPERKAELLERAKAFEAVFVAQTLKQSGFAEALTANSGFGGEHFSSILLEQYATKIVENGGYGLADKIYNQLSEREADNGS